MVTGNSVGQTVEVGGAKRIQTRRDIFLNEMVKVVPWARLTALIEPVYPKGKGGR
jgi:IS5 family transposase